MKRTGTTYKHQYRPENFPEEIELQSHTQDARRQAPKASCFGIMDGKNKRKRWTVYD